MDKLNSYDWPGNVRQLENEIERAVILSQGSIITSQLLSLEPGRASSQIDVASQVRRAVPLEQVLHETELMALTEALRQCDGDRREASQRLGLSLGVFQTKLKQFALS
ncbi:MAG: hypothetical protein NVSMB42_24080 [Herpetosiphon sp.]